MRYADAISNNSNLGDVRQRRGIEQAIPPGYYSTANYSNEGFPYHPVASAYMQQQQLVVAPRSQILPPEQMHLHQQQQNYQYHSGAYHSHLQHHEGAGRVAYPDAQSHLQYYGNPRQEELGPVAMRIGVPVHSGYDPRHPQQPFVDPLQGIMQNLAVAQDRKQRHHRVRLAADGRANESGGFGATESRNPIEESERFTEIYQEVFARHSRTPSEARTPTEHTRAISQTPTTTSDSTSRSGTLEGSSSSTDAEEDEWEENIMSALNDMAGNLKNLGGIHCNQAGPDSTEVQLKLNLPVPLHYMNHLDMAAKQGFNTAIQTLSPKKCNYQFDYSQLDDQVFDIEERFIGTIDQLQGHVIPVYKSLFENQSGSSEDEEDEDEELRRDVSNDSSDSTYEDPRFLPKLSPDSPRNPGPEKRRHIVLRRNSPPTVVQHDVVRDVAENQTILRVPSHIIIADSPSDFSSDDSWRLASPKNIAKDICPPENIPLNSNPFDLTGTNVHTHRQASETEAPRPSIKVSKSFDEIERRNAQTLLKSPLSQRDVTGRDPGIGAFQRRNNSPGSPWIPATKGRLEVVDRETPVTVGTKEEKSLTASQAADPVVSMIKETKIPDHIPEVLSVNRIKSKQIDTKPPPKELNISSEIPTTVVLNLKSADGLEIVESLSDLTMGLGELVLPLSTIQNNPSIVISDIPPAKTSFSGDELMRHPRKSTGPPSPDLDELLGPFLERKTDGPPSSQLIGEESFVNVAQPIIPRNESVHASRSDFKGATIAPKSEEAFLSVTCEPGEIEPSNQSALHHTGEPSDRVFGCPAIGPVVDRLHHTEAFVEEEDEIIVANRMEMAANPAVCDSGTSLGRSPVDYGTSVFLTSTTGNELEHTTSALVSAQVGDGEEAPDDELDLPVYTSQQIQVPEGEPSRHVADYDVPDDEIMGSRHRTSPMDGHGNTSNSQESQAEEAAVPEDELNIAPSHIPPESEIPAQSVIKIDEEHGVPQSTRATRREGVVLDHEAMEAPSGFDIARPSGGDSNRSSRKEERGTATSDYVSPSNETPVASDSAELSAVRDENYEGSFDAPLVVSRTKNRPNKSDREISLAVTNASSDASFRSAREETSSEHTKKRDGGLSIIVTLLEDSGDGTEEETPFDAAFIINKKGPPEELDPTSANVQNEGPLDDIPESSKVHGTVFSHDQSGLSTNGLETSLSRILDANTTSNYMELMNFEDRKGLMSDEQNVVRRLENKAPKLQSGGNKQSPLGTSVEGRDPDGDVGQESTMAYPSQKAPTPVEEKHADRSEIYTEEDKYPTIDFSNYNQDDSTKTFEIQVVSSSRFQKSRVENDPIEQSIKEIVEGTTEEDDLGTSDIDDAETLISHISEIQRDNPDDDVSEPGMIISRHSRGPKRNDGPSSSVDDEKTHRTNISIDERKAERKIGSVFEPRSAIVDDEAPGAPAASQDIRSQRNSIEQTAAQNNVGMADPYNSIDDEKSPSHSQHIFDFVNSDNNRASETETTELPDDDDNKWDSGTGKTPSRLTASQPEKHNFLPNKVWNETTTRSVDEIAGSKKEGSYLPSRNARDRTSLYQVQGFADYCKQLSGTAGTDVGEHKDIHQKGIFPAHYEVATDHGDDSADVFAVEAKTDARPFHSSDDGCDDDRSRSKTSSQSEASFGTSSDCRSEGLERRVNQSRVLTLPPTGYADTSTFDDDAGSQSGSRSRTSNMASSIDEEQSDIHTNFTSESEEEEDAYGRDFATEASSRREVSARALRNEIDVGSERVEIRYLTEHTRSKYFPNSVTVNGTETRSIVTLDDTLHSSPIRLGKDPTLKTDPSITFQRSRTPKSIPTSYSTETPLTSPLTSSFTLDTPLASALTMSTIPTFDQETIYSGQHSVRPKALINDPISSVSNSFHTNKSRALTSTGITSLYLDQRRNKQNVELPSSSHSDSSLSFTAWIHKGTVSMALIIFAWIKHLVEAVMGKKRSALKIGCSPAGLDLQPEQVIRREEIQERIGDISSREQQHRRVGSHSRKATSQYPPSPYQRHQHTTVMMTTMPFLTGKGNLPPWDLADEDDDADEVGTCVESIVPDAHYPSDAEGRARVSTWKVIAPQTYHKASASSRSLGALKKAYSAFSSSASGRRQSRKGIRGEVINWVTDDEYDDGTHDDASSFYGGASVR